MRMLRLSEGWSAERLSQEYEARGQGVLTRTTIAKIEADRRKITVSETAGVARIFDLTSADLLNADGPDVFMSHADEDERTGQEVSAWLSDHGFRVQAGEIDSVHAFVAVLSPSFLSSSRCREELDQARRHKEQLLATGMPGGFLYGLRVPEAADLDDSGLSLDHLIDLPTASERSAGGRSAEAALSKLGARIISNASKSRPSPTQAAQPIIAETAEEDLDRGEELQRVLNALKSPSGDHFWLVVSPPEFGKSWFLDQLKTKATEPANGAWTTQLVDLRDGEEAEFDAMKVIGKLFGLEQSPSADPDRDLRAIATKIIQSHESRLGLLDSADLLPASAVIRLREHLGRIYNLIQDSGDKNSHLAFVAASRRDDRWSGITPYPRVSILPLAEFGPGVIQNALRKLARRMRRERSAAELRKDAEVVQRATEGLPELVRLSLQWIEEEAWLEIDRMSEREFFAHVIAPQVKKQLLAHDSLLPGQESSPPKQLAAMECALRVLAPYRFITRSHVQHHLDSDASFSEALKEAGWVLENLWQAIGNLALLRRPLDEPWHEIQPAIRRLLCRSFYKPSELADAHAKARDFTADWAAKLRGKEQVIGVVESIWHEAARLKLAEDTARATKLYKFAQSLSANLRESSYTSDELRSYAVQRIAGDDELQHEIGDVADLFDTLISAIRAPGPGGDLT